MLNEMTMQAFWKRMAAFAVAVGIGFSALPARAAEPAADDGWFDPPGSTRRDAPTPNAEPNGAVRPDGSQLPSLAPSPLLDERPGSYAAPPSSSAPEPADSDPRALSDFRPELDPYGSWLQHATYGLVWVPRQSVVGTGFAPYVSSGRWALDQTGNWVWVSDYPFGDVVFHYGRWVWASDAGWVWIPGYRYAPAWVQWRVPVGGSAYVGWAPLGPDYIWYNGVAVSYWYGTPTPWVFCPSGYVFHRHVNHYIVRDRVVLNRAAAGTRRYVPASARVASGARAFEARSPSLAAARVPRDSVPRERMAAAPRVRTRSAVEPRGGEPMLPSPRRAPAVRSPAAPGFAERRWAAPERQRVAPGSGSPERLAPRRISPERAAQPNVPERRIAPTPRPAPGSGGFRPSPSGAGSRPVERARIQTDAFRPQGTQLRRWAPSGVNEDIGRQRLRRARP